MVRVAAIGEVMVELSPSPQPISGINRSAGSEERKAMMLSYAGDTFNTAVYMARLGVATEYTTILGDDPYSDAILAWLKREGIGTGTITRQPGRLPGLYMIQNSADGEREFSYWRNDAPARLLFQVPAAVDALAGQLFDCDYLYLSGITLAIMTPAARTLLLAFLRSYRRQGGRVVFDSNYRPRLWRDSEEARGSIIAVLGLTDIALLTLEDEQLLWGDGDVESCLARYRKSGIAELVLKRGAEETLLFHEGQLQRVPVAPVEGVVDTTGAGDTFNAGYMAARAKGWGPAAAAREGNRCAAIVIRHHGGVIGGDDFLAEYCRNSVLDPLYD